METQIKNPDGSIDTPNIHLHNANEICKKYMDNPPDQMVYDLAKLSFDAMSFAITETYCQIAYKNHKQTYDYMKKQFEDLQKVIESMGYESSIWGIKYQENINV